MDVLNDQTRPEPKILSFRFAVPTPGPDGPVVGSATPTISTLGLSPSIASPSALKNAGETADPLVVPVASLR